MTTHHIDHPQAPVSSAKNVGAVGLTWLKAALCMPALLLLWAPGIAGAQWINLVELRSEYLPPTPLDGGRPAGDAPWSHADDAQLSTYSVAANLPLPLNNSTLLVAGLGYRLDSLSFSHESPAERELKLHAFEVPITLLHLLSSEWTLLLNVAPGMASDLHNVDSQALRASGLALASYALSDGLTLGAGLAASLDFGTLLPIPVVYVKWEPHPRVKVDGMLPAQIDAKVVLGDRFEVGVHADIEGNSYAIGNSSIRSAWPCAATADDPATATNESRADQAQCVHKLAYSVATGGVVLSARLVSSIWLSLYVGHTFFRRFEQMNADNKRVAGGSQTLPNEFFARVGLTWRLPDSDETSTPQNPSSAASQEESR